MTGSDSQVPLNSLDAVELAQAINSLDAVELAQALLREFVTEEEPNEHLDDFEEWARKNMGPDYESRLPEHAERVYRAMRALVESAQFEPAAPPWEDLGADRRRLFTLRMGVDSVTHSFAFDQFDAERAGHGKGGTRDP